MMPTLKICALGSSFAAGPGIPPLSNVSAGRSSKNYASILAQKLGAHLTDLSVSGATLQNVTHETQTTMDGTRFAPQITLLPEDTEIVTLTAGGNDLGYIGGIMRDEMACSAQGRQFLEVMPISGPDEKWTSEKLAERFISVIDQIILKAPRAKILLVEYLCVVGDDTRAGVDVDMAKARIDHHRGVADMLKHAYRLAAKTRQEKCEVMKIADLSQSHCLGAKDSWVNGFSIEKLMGGGVFHPNARGMEAIADILVKRLETNASK